MRASAVAQGAAAGARRSQHRASGRPGDALSAGPAVPVW